MFELPGMDTVTEVVVNEEAVGPDAQPLMIHDKSKKKNEPASAG
jgi:ATP-dependent Clp protease ATP-binding subunit ClpX